MTMKTAYRNALKVFDAQHRFEERKKKEMLVKEEALLGRVVWLKCWSIEFKVEPEDPLLIVGRVKKMNLTNKIAEIDVAWSSAKKRNLDKDVILFFDEYRTLSDEEAMAYFI